MKYQKGFSLIELLIVVVVLGVIAAIAIPNLLASRRAANEASAISSLRTYHGAQMTYQGGGGAGNYAGETTFTPTAFKTLADTGLLDEALGDGSKSGYLFIGSAIPASDTAPASFIGMAVPSSITAALPSFTTAFFRVSLTDFMQTGTRYFGIVNDGVVHHEHIANFGNGMMPDGSSGSYHIVNGTPLEIPVQINNYDDGEVIFDDRNGTGGDGGSSAY